MSRRHKLYAMAAVLLLVLVFLAMSALFPEAKTEAAAVCRTEPETAGNGFLNIKIADNSQNGTINGRISAPSGYPDELSAMPCCMASNDFNAFNALDDVGSASEPETEETGFRLYRIAGELPDPALQRAIWDALQAEGIAYWYEGALAQCFQESHFEMYAVNQKNGVDSGLYQYRSTFWDWEQGDIFDANLQIRKYAAEMAARFNAGLSADEAISRHKTSDYCEEVDREYVQQVRQWLGQMEEVK